MFTSNMSGNYVFSLLYLLESLINLERNATSSREKYDNMQLDLSGTDQL